MSTQLRKLKEKEKRRQDILKAAGKLFKTIGYKNTSMDMVAQKSHLSKGTLYLYFKNKDDLYASCVLQDGLSNLSALFEEAERTKKSVIDIIISYTDSFYKFTKDYPELFNLMFGVNSAEGIDLCNVSEETRQLMETYQREIFRSRVEVFRRGVREGIFSDDISACYAVIQIWASISGALYMSQKEQLKMLFENINPQDFIRDIAKMYVIAYSKSENVRKKLLSEVWENAVAQAPSVIRQDENFIKEINFINSKKVKNDEKV